MQDKSAEGMMPSQGVTTFMFIYLYVYIAYYLLKVEAYVWRRVASKAVINSKRIKYLSKLHYNRCLAHS